ncbi:MAG: hypothetical protein KDA71_25825, partial [Planctomycetales bacterium]|nr:hypothetical protein [Planctomycetales bacterium]
ILGRAPTSQCVRVDVVPAGAHNRSEFMTEHVRAVISDWLEGTEQRRRAENFLAQGEPDE